MTLHMKRPDKKTLLMLWGAIAVMPIVVFSFWALGIVFTYTGSVPMGFYRAAASDEVIKRGDFVSVCLPTEVAVFGIARGYIHSGYCSGGAEPLIKQVIAIPGDDVKLGAGVITVSRGNYHMDYVAPIQPYDKNHLSIKRAVHDGHYNAQGYWVYGAGSPNYSWDSRYYGSVAKKNIIEHLQPLWLF